MPEKKSRKRKEDKGKRVTVKKQVKTRVTVNVKQSSGGGGVVAAPYWHPPPISNYVPTTTTLMSAVTSPLIPGNVGETNLANQMAAMQKSIDSLAQAFPAAKAAPSTAEAGIQASPSTAEAGTQASTSSAEAGTQFEDPDPDPGSMQADAGAQTVSEASASSSKLRLRDPQIDTPPRADNRRRRRRDVADSNPRPHKRRRISDEEPVDMVGDLPPPPPPRPPGPKPPGFASAPGRLRDARKAHAHQKRVRNVLDTVAYRKDVLADLKATPYREPPRPRPAPAAPVEPPKAWKTKPALKIKLKGFKAPELPPEVVKASKKGKRLVGKRNDNNFVMGIV